ncbi:hypothetical protein K491DRAFT_762046 [Lophiostoma macrostomum CBS 122681]|uniref:Uncharacterized protein n=1 Tax=Lophiostoma macrostomum CBS 122681 TaxID=1314788 RepID=A0A6A6SSI7_9PLEO|nr:hypothetical protein K491DRAFT_762046 [Lophiostoma macrostomum CBS 122681]
MSYTTFRGLCLGLDGYIDEIAPYQIDPGQLLFPTLPLEIRTQIYTYVLFLHARTSLYPDLRSDIISENFIFALVAGGCGIYTSSSSYPPWLPELYLVNEATRIDYGLFFIRNAIFGLEPATLPLQYMESFLETFPGEQGFASVRRLECSELGTYRTDPGQYIRFRQIVERCRGITVLRLTITYRGVRRTYPECVYHDLGPCYWDAGRLLTAEEIVEAYDLTSLAQNEFLDTIHLGLPDSIYVRDDPASGVGRLKKLEDLRPLYDEIAGILRRAWERRGRKLNLRMTFSQRRPYRLRSINIGVGRHKFRPRAPHWVPSIYHVNETTRIEVGFTLLRSAQFEIRTYGCLQYFIAFLNTFPDNAGFASMRRLFLSDFWWAWNKRMHLKADVEFMKSCPNLQEVRLRFARCGLLKLHEQNPVFWSTQAVDFMTIEEIARRHHLGEIAGMKTLRKIVLAVDPTFRLHNIPPRDGSGTEESRSIDALVAGVKEWLDADIKQKGNRAKVEVLSREEWSKAYKALGHTY